MSDTWGVCPVCTCTDMQCQGTRCQDPNPDLRLQEVLGIPKGKEVNLVPSGYPGLAYLPNTPGVVVTVGFRNPDALPGHLLGCAPWLHCCFWQQE